ncbi:MAG: bifunctional riboflavin kinase/FAD synthetase [Deltaproteobacteria bacterium]|nr:MAG: bifunctional riboflavin kinase/FAD synthetase [Deltaproteobacteria bacterium]
MEVFEGHRALFRPLASPAVCLGNFDGVHVGHRRLIDATVAAARAHRGDAVAFTFDPHPATVLAADLAPPLITSRERKLELLADAGVDVCILEPFTPDLARMPPSAFVDLLADVIGARHVVVGYDFTFGRDRAGTPDTLRAAGAARGFDVTVVPQVTVDGLVASSTKIRDFALLGKLDGVRRLLGRDLDVDGVVVRGDRRGRTLGFPTANVAVPAGLLLPPPGVYAVRAVVLDDRRAFGGVANLGTRPTFREGDNLALEVHLFDFDGDLYGRRIRVAFVDRIRGERRFDGVDALVAQIRADADRARAILTGDNT